MGTFMRVGLLRKFELNLDSPYNNYSPYKSELIEELQNKFSEEKLEINLVNLVEEEIKKYLDLTGENLPLIRTKKKKSYIWEISDKIFESEFVLFLEEFYKNYNYQDKDNEKTISILSQKKTTKDILKTIKNKHFFNCHFYQSFFEVELSMKKEEGNFIYRLSEEFKIDYETIIFTSEGKVFFEELDRHLRLFRKGLRKLFSKYQIANLFDIYIF
jgi:hypothetical protein